MEGHNAVSIETLQPMVRGSQRLEDLSEILRWGISGAVELYTNQSLTIDYVGQRPSNQKYQELSLLTLDRMCGGRLHAVECKMELIS